MRTKNLLRKIIVILCIAVMIFQVGCKDSSDEESNSASTSTSSLESTSESTSAPTPTPAPEPTDGYIVDKNGISAYKILTPEILDDNLEIAVSELQYGIEQTCGYKMETTDEYESGKKYLSIGRTQLYENNKETVVKGKLNRTDVRVVTLSDDSVVMIGGNSEYTVYAVYEFMEYSFGFKWYTNVDAKIVKSDNIRLMDFDLLDSPDISYRSFHQYEYEYETTGGAQLNARRMRVLGFSEDFITREGHTLSQIMPLAKYATEHPEWFTNPTGSDYDDYNNGTQLCLTNEEMTAQFIENCKELILNNFDKTYFMIGINDNKRYCTCANCVALAKKNNANGTDNGERTGNFIIFANKVVREIKSWVKTIDPDKELIFPIFAYFHTVNAPVKEVNGKYVPVNDDVIPDESIAVMYAPLENDFTYSFDDSRNLAINSTLTKWQAVTNNIIVYSYGVPYGANSMLPMNNLLTMGGSYSMAAKNNYAGYLEESNTTSLYAGQEKLKTYISSSVWWDASRSVDDYAYEFIDFYYAPVATEFKQYYADLKQFQTYQIETLGLRVGIQSAKYNEAQYWPYGSIMHFSNALDNMLDKIKGLKVTDPVAYQTYFDRINIEKLWVNYALCQFYSSKYNASDYLSLVDFMNEYMLQYNVGASSRERLVSSWKKLK